MTEWMYNFWPFLLLAIIFIALMVYAIMAGKAVEWLKYAVAVAEYNLGSGTGQLKLRQVYDMFIDKFPGFSSIVPFAIFSYWVDLALDWFKGQLEKNPDIKSYIKGE